MPENETLDLWTILARRSTYLGNLIVDADSRVVE